MRQIGRQRDRRHVSASRERVTGADRPEEFAVEILLIVIAEGVRCVLQQRKRMDLSLVERERVNEWL